MPVRLRDQILPAPSSGPASRLSRAGLVVAAVACLSLVGNVRSAAAQSDSTAVATAVHRFHEALAAGDTVAVIALLGPTVQVLESGGLESRSEYIAGHMRADMAFASAVPRSIESMQVRVSGDVAWVVSVTVTAGEYRGRAVNSRGAELMVLTRAPDGWKIAAVHWSSRAARSGAPSP